MIDVDRLDQMCATVRDVTAAGIDGLDPAGLERTALTARRLRELVDRLEVHALGALEETGATDVEHGETTTNWFARAADVAPAAASTQIKLARVLCRHLPGTDQAWLDGRITRDHVTVLVRAANPRIRQQISDAETDLIDLVEGRSFATWKDAVAAVVAAIDQDGPEPDDPANTTAAWSRSGAFAELRARFAGCNVEALEQIIEHKTDELFRAAVRDRDITADLPIPTRAQLRGLAIETLLLEAAGADPATTKTSRPSVNLVLRALPKTGPVLVNGLPTLHTVDEPADDDRGGWPVLGSLNDAHWSLTNLNGDHLLLAHFATLLCDCDIHPMLVDAAGNPLKLGDTVHIAPPKLRKAVLIRDGGCTHPGCNAPVSWLDVHHVRPYEHGGPTDIDNLAALCRRHHRLAHRKGWTMTAVGDGWFWWGAPSGHGYWSQRHGQQRAGPAPPQAMAA